MTHVVVVLNWFGRRDTVACVDSLRSGSPQAEVLVVDNGSFDGALEEVERRFLGVHTLQTGANTGFTGGMNAGLRWALAAGAEAVTILNNDTIVPPGAMARLAAVARGGVAVSPVVAYTQDPERIWFAGGEIEAASGLPHHGPSVRLRPTDADGLRETDILAGACVTATAATWRRVGLLDERYYLLFEDSDWSRRAVASGVSLRVDTRTTIHHQVSASFGGEMSYLGLFYYVRNGILFIRSAGGGGRLVGRFLRRHVLPGVREGMAGPGRRAGARRAVMAGAGVLAAAGHRFGPAPAPIHRLATRWSRLA